MFHCYVFNFVFYIFDCCFAGGIVRNIGIKDYERVLSCVDFNDGEVIVGFECRCSDRASSVDWGCCIKLSMSDAVFKIKLTVWFLQAQDISIVSVMVCPSKDFILFVTKAVSIPSEELYGIFLPFFPL